MGPTKPSSSADQPAARGMRPAQDARTGWACGKGRVGPLAVKALGEAPRIIDCQGRDGHALHPRTANVHQHAFPRTSPSRCGRLSCLDGRPPSAPSAHGILATQAALARSCPHYRGRGRGRGVLCQLRSDLRLASMADARASAAHAPDEAIGHEHGAGCMASPERLGKQCAPHRPVG